MNKEKREPYRALTTVMLPEFSTASLCAFCRYAEWIGSCEEADLDCKHPLGWLERWEPFDVWEGHGSDCWAFRPEVDIDEAADMVGIWLNGQFVAP